MSPAYKTSTAQTNKSPSCKITCIEQTLILTSCSNAPMLDTHTHVCVCVLYYIMFGCLVILYNVWLFNLSHRVVPHSAGFGVKSVVVFLSMFI